MNWKEKRYSTFKIGDIVRKARRFSNDDYCKYGGGDDEVPIGSLGKVLDTDVECKRPPERVEGRDETYVYVSFDNGYTWYTDRKELELK